jgi:hypothetical protein
MSLRCWKKILFGVRKGGRKGGRVAGLEYPHGIYIPIQRIPSYIPSPPSKDTYLYGIFLY